MNNVENSTSKSPFFPNQKPADRPEKVRRNILPTNDPARKIKIDEMAKRDAKVDIADAVKDFSRIKSAVDAAPEIDNSAKIAKLKAEIKNGTYNIDYDAVADKLLESEYY
ncbi:MAG: flagellar biosynthesis anti-sigma factor FlgM [Bdellovibrionales bacterium RIFOXYD12_FULL_39_22]|nr:MAG: flagellar biosynthesis anti-sigma factor FlgM [Bdellovibrionales bacterium RIFOXYB1_FULL_39_21]OFZ42071.1 MAG: flagellar biosynthesis anti-sigma factor FlgM [Bdellovibrionales bacterium RIFOXYC12_FULL_39_17]OFZ50787.1 MAG: flagellar biosynthesis anti-sigma factor FlgM [Bdellovibrionales bacterium RIFOXYC1_FULL_39_130]OFZ78010.1 MAG: flagellar biosynthesis anti-sigma factor FlgM [Bdellovibrionales bacterium RIFOXYD1_FULL_39_84]OFZ93554.1 MAG: flagellar biosynthesis anti-sigma factor FlgM